MLIFDIIIIRGEDMRKFEKIRDEFLKYGQKAEDIKIPVRATKSSVAYDFFSPIDYVLKPGERKLIFTNIKAQYNPDEALILAVRSSMGKAGVCLANGIGIIETDYFENPDNDGNLGFFLYNFGENEYVIRAGDKIGQGFFTKYLTVDNEEEITTTRKGGFGSTNN